MRCDRCDSGDARPVILTVTDDDGLTLLDECRPVLCPVHIAELANAVEAK